MKTKTLFISVLLTLVLVCSMSYCQNITITVQSSKDEYLVGEPVWIHVSLFNNGPDDVLNLDKGHLLNGIVLENSVGSRLEKGLSLFVDAGGSVLTPGDSIYSNQDISSVFADVLHERYNKRVFSPGVHIVYCQLPGFSSNRASFQITEPNDEESAVLDLLCRGSALRDNCWEGIRIFEQIIEQYPQSVYVEKTYFYLSLFCKMHCNDCGELFWKYNRQFLENYPNSWYIAGAISDNELKYRRDRDPEGARNFFQDLIRRHPDTRMAKDAQMRIDRMNEFTVDQWTKLHLEPIERIRAPQE